MPSDTVVVVNGCAKNDLSVLDRGFAYGDGVFETMLLSNDDITLWAYHYQRLSLGLQCLHINLTKEDLLKHLIVTFELSSEAFPNQLEFVFKLMVTRGQGGQGYTPAIEQAATLVSVVRPYNASNNMDHATGGIAAHYCTQRLPINASLAGLKTLNQLPYVLASRERELLDVQEGLLFSEADQLIEATARNVFIVKDGELYTPPLNSSGVAGVMRRLLVEQLAQQQSITVHQIPLSKKNVQLADEVFLTNSITGIWPLLSCEGQKWDKGPVTGLLQQALSEFLLNNKVLSFSSTSSSLKITVPDTDTTDL